MNRKEKYKQLRELGLSSKKAKVISSYGKERYKKELSKINKNIAARARRAHKKEILYNAGFNDDIVRKLYNKSYDYIYNYVNENSNANMIIYMDNSIEDYNQKSFQYEKAWLLRNTTMEDNIETIFEMITNVESDKKGYLLFPDVLITYNKTSDIYYRNAANDIIAYCGRGINLRNILVALRLCVTQIYDITERNKLISKTIFNLKSMPYKKAIENGNKLYELFLSNNTLANFEFLEDFEDFN